MAPSEGTFATGVDGSDAAGEPGQRVLPLPFFGRSDVADPLGDVLDVGGGNLAPMFSTRSFCTTRALSCAYLWLI